MPDIHGHCEPEFAPIKDAFARNFDTGLELGASVAVTRGDEVAVYLWGGYRDADRTLPWEENTICFLASSTKIPTAIAVLMLIDQGLIHPDDPVVKYWPEFGQHGKDRVLIRHFLSHTAGLPGPWPPIPFAQYFDWEAMVKHYEEAELWWEPGSAFGYHSESFGFLNGEVVRRVTGRTLGTFLKEEVFSCLDADIFIGLPKTEFGRMATMVPLDLAPPVEALPAQCPNPEGIVGNWYGEGVAMHRPSRFCLEIVAESKELKGDISWYMGSNAYHPDVEETRFDGTTLRMRASFPGGLICWDANRIQDNVLSAQLYIAGEEIDITLKRLDSPPSGFSESTDESDESSLLYRVQNGVLPPKWIGSRSLTSEIPHANGMANARSLAQVGSIIANGGTVNGIQFLKPETIDLILTEETYSPDAINEWNVRFGLGFGLNSTEFPCPSDRSAHWGGAGGSVCIMDTESRTTLAYVMNGQLASSKSDPRNESLRKAWHQSLGVPTEPLDFA